MGKKTQEKSVAFFERNSWYHRTKALQDNGIVKYGKKGVFSSQAEAEASYRKCEEEFNALLRKQQLSSKSNKDVLFKDYLIYWFEEVFSKRIETTTRMVGAYALYDLTTLVIAHNKTLAAQLYGEFKEMFPENAVEYFVSYYGQ